MVAPQTRSGGPLPGDAVGQPLLPPTRGSRGTGLAADRFTEERRSRRSSRPASARETTGEKKGAAGGAPSNARVPTASGTAPNMATAGHVEEAIAPARARGNTSSHSGCNRMAVRGQVARRMQNPVTAIRRYASRGSVGRPWGSPGSTAQARRETREPVLAGASMEKGAAVVVQVAVVRGRVAFH
ncbi:hypothetical protein HPB50_016495 [Hyalomma asiaticum]|uniref:Uncharacterized protein n=1 Tax=Hyalomma asiaticum TaxID=266040 RepID=A0ACB7T1B1_HYAAI|nr:hypothetical protein HPB50_016495 [Hyalomma asiaticum]